MMKIKLFRWFGALAGLAFGITSAQATTFKLGRTSIASTLGRALHHRLPAGPANPSERAKGSLGSGFFSFFHHCSRAVAACALVVLLLALPISVQAQGLTTVDGVTFQVLQNSIPVPGPVFAEVTGLADPNQTAVVIPSTITVTMDVEVAVGVYELETVTAPVTGIDQFGAHPKLVSLTIPASATYIAQGSFANCISLTSVVLPDGVSSSRDGVSSIADSLFQNCSNLTSVNIPSGVTSIGDAAFAGCAALRNVTIPDTVSSIGQSVFAASGLTTIQIPDSTLSMGLYAFINCPLLTGVTIGNGLQSIPEDAFLICALLNSVTIGNNVQSIGGGAFANCSLQAGITLGNNVLSIGDYAFNNCSELSSVTIGNGVQSIGQSAFADCPLPGGVTLGTGLTTIGDEAFEYCTSLPGITIPANVTSIGQSAFDGCSMLNAVTIGDNSSATSTSIGVLAFASCKDLSSVTLGNNVTSIGVSAFASCTSLASITIPNLVTSIGYGVFSGCSSLTSVTIPNTVTSIGDSAFSGCSSLAGISIPNVLSIGDSAFFGCASLDSVILGAGLTSIGVAAFENCTSLPSITIPINTSISSYAFYYCSGLKSVFFQGGPLSTSDPSVFGADRGATGYYLAANAALWIPPNSQTYDGIPMYELGTIQVTITPSDAACAAQWQVTDSSGDIYGPYASSDIAQGLPPGLYTVTFQTVVGWTPSTPASTTVTVNDTTPATASFTYTPLFDYIVNSSGAGVTITGYRGPTGIGQVVDVPAEFDCLPVTGLASSSMQYPFSSGISTINILHPNPSLIIDPATFSGCSDLTAINVNNPTYASDSSGVVFGPASNPTTLYFYPPALHAHGAYTIPSGITTIGADAFAGSELNSVTIPDTVTSIGSSAFFDCIDLESVLFQGTPPNASGTVFSDLPNNALGYYLAVNTQWASIMSYHGLTMALANGSLQVSFSPSGGVVPCDGGWNVDVDGGPWQNNNANIPVSAGNHTVYFKSVAGWSTPTPKSVTVNLNALTLEAGTYTPYFTYTPNPASPGSDITITGYTGPGGTVNIPEYFNCDHVVALGPDVFNGASPSSPPITTINIPLSVNSIDAAAFFQCSSLTAINVESAAYASVNGVVFDQAASLTTLYFYPPGLNPGGDYAIPNGITTLGDGAFYGSLLATVTIPISVLSIGQDSFEDSSLQGITIPASVNSIGSRAFYDCNNLGNVFFQGNPPGPNVSTVFGNATGATGYYLAANAPQWLPDLPTYDGLTMAQNTFTVSPTTEVVGPSGVSNGGLITLTGSGFWTASASSDDGSGNPWLSVSPSSGNGPTSLTFNCAFNNSTNPRVGTLNIAGQTVTVTQAGTASDPSGPVPVIQGQAEPNGVAVDSQDDVFVADGTAQTISEYVASSGSEITLVTHSAGLQDPTGLAVDGNNDLFIADGTGATIYELTAPSGGVINTPISGPLSPLVSGTPGLNDFTGVAVDGTGNNLFYTDSGNGTSGNGSLWEWINFSSSPQPTSPVWSGLWNPQGVAVDGSGDVYVANSGTSQIAEWVPSAPGTTTGTLNYLASTPASLNDPTGVAWDNVHNMLYIADTGDSAIYQYTPGTGLTMFFEADPNGIAVDSAGNIYFSDTTLQAVEEIPNVYVNTTPVTEPATAGSDSLPPVIPATTSLTGAFAPTSDSAWLTITGTANGVVSFSFTANPGPARTANITLLGLTIPVTQAGGIAATLGSTSRLEGPGSGGDSVILLVNPSSATWTATANAPWLNVTTASGTGNATVFFTYSANPGPTRTGTLTIAGQTVTVTQAGATYSPVTTVTPLIYSADPTSVAVDASGDVFYGDVYYDGVFEFPAGGNFVSEVAYSGSGLGVPQGLAVDQAGNLYIADGGADDSGTPGNYVIEEFPAGSSPGTPLTTLATQSSGLGDPLGVAVDTFGNIYIADGYTYNNYTYLNDAVEELPTGATSVNVLADSLAGLVNPQNVAVDLLGNMFIEDNGGSAIDELPAGGAPLVTLANVNNPIGVAVDGADNVYFGNGGADEVEEFPAGTAPLAPWTTLANSSTGLEAPNGVAVDSAGDVFIADSGAGRVEELPHAFVDQTPLTEGSAAGSDSLPAVLPATANLSGPFAPVSYSSWLTITGTANGVVSFSFTANPGLSRTGYINLLGLTIVVTQAGEATATLGSNNRLEGPGAGADSVILAINAPSAAWLAYSYDSWLTFTSFPDPSYPYYTAGTGSAVVQFNVAANSGATRTGYLYIAGQWVTVTQAGSTYSPVTSVTPIASSSDPTSVAVDGSGDVFYGDVFNDVVNELPAGSTSPTTIASVSSGLGVPQSLAVDPSGNLYIADGGADDNNTPGNYAIEEFPAGATAGTSLTTVAGQSSGLDDPLGVAVDTSGNVYIADGYTYNNGTYNNDAVEELSAGGTSVTVLANSATSLVNPLGLAVDLLGNLFIDDNGGGTVDEFSAGSLPGAPLVTLESLGVNSPSGVAVDGGGNLFFGNAGVNEVEEFPAGTVPLAPYTTVANAASGQSSEAAVAVDSSGDVYIADWKAGQVEELPHAFVDQTPRAELATAGSDSLPAVLSAIANFTGPLANLTGPFAPTTDAGSSAWLSITGVSGGVVTYAFTANPGATRTGYITVLGLTIPVTQGGTTLSAAAYTVYRPAGVAAHIFWSNVQTNWSDVPGAAITLSPFNPVSGNGVALLENSSQILYPASAPNVNDEINYTITDNFGATASGVINVLVDPFPQTGQLSGALTISGGSATVSFYGIIGQTYEIQRSTDLVNWVTVDTATVDSSGKITFTDTFPDLGSPPASAYYRLAWQP